MRDEFLACLERRDGALYIEACALQDLADRYGTPLYLYSRAEIERAFAALTQALADRDHLICYAVKANSNIAILNLFARLGAGFDIVSGGELARVLRAGGDPKKVVFSGVGKSHAELRQALQAGILCFNVESANELARLQEVASALGVKAPVSVRVNPDVDPKTHPYIATGLTRAKFGIAFPQALEVYRQAKGMPNIELTGIDFHIGSQITDTQPYADAVARLVDMVSALKTEGIELEHIDLGGGLGIRYRDESPVTPQQYAQAVLPLLAKLPHRIVLEPGRYLVGNAGVLLTRVEHLKQGAQKRFAIVDAAMNDLIRPALYDAYQHAVPVRARATPAQLYDIVGPVCESGDFLGLERPLAIAEGDLLAVLGAGAYGFSMSSNYNSRPRAAEVLVDGDRAHLIRQRESVESLFALESIPDLLTR
jgi:diaminopimelate decarboxylase